MPLYDCHYEVEERFLLAAAVGQLAVANWVTAGINWGGDADPLE
ncbi:hypothetical protein ABZ726_23505 [Streptomyces hundungensis]